MTLPTHHLGAFTPLQHVKRPLKNESFTLLAAACLSRFGETTTSCPVCSDPTGVDCENKKKKTVDTKISDEKFTFNQQLIATTFGRFHQQTANSIITSATINVAERVFISNLQLQSYDAGQQRLHLLRLGLENVAWRRIPKDFQRFKVLRLPVECELSQEKSQKIYFRSFFLLFAVFLWAKS